MDAAEVERQILAAWRRHNDILLFLLRSVPRGGMTAVPAGSKGRDVARQFAHLDRVRRGWIAFHRSGTRPKLPRFDKGPPPSKAKLRAALVASGKDVGALVQECLRTGTTPRMFGKDIVRWAAYLISHESHHRGQIMLALKQSGFRIPAAVAVNGLWGKWIFGS